MKQATLTIVTILGCMFICGCNPSPSQSYVKVECRVETETEVPVEIFFDGTLVAFDRSSGYKDRTPKCLEIDLNLPLGKHKLTYIADGYEKWERMVLLTGGSTRVNVALKKQE